MEMRLLRREEHAQESKTARAHGIPVARTAFQATGVSFPGVTCSPECVSGVGDLALKVCSYSVDEACVGSAKHLKCTRTCFVSLHCLTSADA